MATNGYTVSELEVVDVTGGGALTPVSMSSTASTYLETITTNDISLLLWKFGAEELKVTKDNGRKSGEELDQLLAAYLKLLVLRLALCRANCLTKVINNIRP